MHKSAITIIALLFSSLTLTAQEDMDKFVSALMEKMTVEEKIGQLNLMPGTSFTTGEPKDNPLLQMAAEGKLGAVLNMSGEKNLKILHCDKACLSNAACSANSCSNCN